jgi:CRP/FNR family transcriptional regulator, cyclic AMP receptor protein
MADEKDPKKDPKKDGDSDKEKKHVMKLKKDEFLVHEGHESKEMYYVVSGSLIVIKRKGNKEHVIGNIFSGELVGEMAFLDKLPRSASVKAAGDCELVVIQQEKLDKYMKTLEPWFSALMRTLVNRLRTTNAKISS